MRRARAWGRQVGGRQVDFPRRRGGRQLPPRQPPQKIAVTMTEATSHRHKEYDSIYEE